MAKRTAVTHARSCPVRYEVVDKDGFAVGGSYASASTAAAQAARWWPDQEQDHDRTGNGWDIQAIR